jgi:AhpD family alkylhydroperoxidase
MPTSKCNADGLFSPSVGELVAIGAAIAANCEPCFKFHCSQARKLGVSKKDIAKAVATAKGVKEAPADSVLSLADRILGMDCAKAPTYLPKAGTCCRASKPGKKGHGCDA